MTAADPIIFIDGVEYRLSDYPTAYREYLEFDMIEGEQEQAEEIEFAGFTPTDCITEVHREWQKRVAIVDGSTARAYELGTVYNGIVGFYPGGGFSVNSESDEEDCSPDEEFAIRLGWLDDKQGYVVWVRRDDTGDGIMLADTVYMVAFTDKALEAQFVAAFPEARP